MPSPIPDGKGQPSLTLHRYGVGVDCHSRFFQVCVLIPNGTEIVKIERHVPALWPELRAAKESKGEDHENKEGFENMLWLSAFACTPSTPAHLATA